LDFDDSGWSAGPAPLGYGDPHIATTVSFGPDSSAKYTTTYFRTTFLVEDPSRVTALTLALLRDDGAVVYVNGREATRDNMPSGLILPTTFALGGIGGADETTYQPHVLNPALVEAGVNVVAVEMHQQSNTSSDLGFDLFLSAEEKVAVTEGIADYTVEAGQPVRFFAEAIDPDRPVQQIHYALAPGAPGTAQIDPLSGEFNWTPAESDGPARVPITITATDSGQPPMQDAQTFTVTVIAPFEVATDASYPGRLTWPAIPGQDYRVEYTDRLHLPEWQLLQEFTATAPDIVIDDPTADQTLQRFYRVLWLW
jgi:hypothetical protein